jgi:hypothetical protein
MPAGLQILIVFLLVLLNIGISWWNAYAAGSCWVEAKQAGGGRRFMVWMVAAMSGAGFTWSYFIIIGFILGATHVLNADQLQVLFDIGYVLVAPVILFSGYAITLHSWKVAYQTRTFRYGGVAGWNTFATAYNTYNVVRGIGPAISKIFDALTKASPKNQTAGYYWMFVAAIAATLLGVITTAVLIHHYAANDHIDDVAARARQNIHEGRYV